MKVKEYKNQDIYPDFFLWYEDFEEAGIEWVAVAIEDGEVIGFQSINGDGRCVAIEVLPEYQGQGVATALVEYTGCTKPEQNENPEFWGKFDE
jgi:GNAT superfamily N-acetyltransferase